MDPLNDIRYGLSARQHQELLYYGTTFVSEDLQDDVYMWALGPSRTLDWTRPGYILTRTGSTTAELRGDEAAISRHRQCFLGRIPDEDVWGWLLAEARWYAEECAAGRAKMIPWSRSA